MQIIPYHYLRSYAFHYNFYIRPSLLSKYKLWKAVLAPRYSTLFLYLNVYYLNSKFLVFQHLVYMVSLFLKKPAFVWSVLPRNNVKHWHVGFLFATVHQFFPIYERIIYFFYTAYYLDAITCLGHANDFFLFSIRSLLSPDDRLCYLFIKQFVFNHNIRVGMHILPAKSSKMFGQRALLRLSNIPLRWY